MDAELGCVLILIDQGSKSSRSWKPQSSSEIVFKALEVFLPICKQAKRQAHVRARLQDRHGRKAKESDVFVAAVDCTVASSDHIQTVRHLAWFADTARRTLLKEQWQ